MHSSDVYISDKVLTALLLPFWPLFPYSCASRRKWYLIQIFTFISTQSELGFQFILISGINIVIIHTLEISWRKLLNTFHQRNKWKLLGIFPSFLLPLSLHLLLPPLPPFFLPSILPSVPPFSFLPYFFFLLKLISVYFADSEQSIFTVKVHSLQWLLWAGCGEGVACEVRVREME